MTLAYNLQDHDYFPEQLQENKASAPFKQFHCTLLPSYTQKNSGKIREACQLPGAYPLWKIMGKTSPPVCSVPMIGEASYNMARHAAIARQTWVVRLRDNCLRYAHRHNHDSCICRCSGESQIPLPFYIRVEKERLEETKQNSSVWVNGLMPIL